MKLHYTPEAVADLVRIADDIRVHNPAAALRVRAAILDSIQTLILVPGAGRRQAAGEAVILNIKHPAQRREHEDA